MVWRGMCDGCGSRVGRKKQRLWKTNDDDVREVEYDDDDDDIDGVT